MLASCFSFVLDVARYVFELTTNHLLNNPMKSVQDLMTDLGLSDDLLTIDDEEARGCGRVLNRLGGGETTAREVADARGRWGEE